VCPIVEIEPLRGRRDPPTCTRRTRTRWPRRRRGQRAFTAASHVATRVSHLSRQEPAPLITLNVLLPQTGKSALPRNRKRGRRNDGGQRALVCDCDYRLTAEKISDTVTSKPSHIPGSIAMLRLRNSVPVAPVPVSRQEHRSRSAVGKWISRIQILRRNAGAGVSRPPT